jgi:hypothetical protein
MPDSCRASAPARSGPGGSCGYAGHGFSRHDAECGFCQTRLLQWRDSCFLRLGHRGRGWQALSAGVFAQTAQEVTVPAAVRQEPTTVDARRASELRTRRRAVVRGSAMWPQLEAPSATADASFHPTGRRHAIHLTHAEARRRSVWSGQARTYKHQSTNELPPAARSAEPRAPRRWPAYRRAGGGQLRKESPHRSRNFSSLSAASDPPRCSER